MNPSTKAQFEVCRDFIVVIAAIVTVWVAIRDAEHRGSDMTPVVLAIVFTVASLVVMAIAYRNLHDIGRAESLRAQIATIKDECGTQTTKRDNDIRALMDENTSLRAQLKNRQSHVYAVARNRNLAETSAAFYLLANQAERQLTGILKYLLINIDKETDAHEWSVCKCPLKTLAKRLDDGVEWRDAHRAIYRFQGVYPEHIADIQTWRQNIREEITFSTPLMSVMISNDDSNTPTLREAIGLLESHVTALRDHAAKLREQFDKSATIL